MSGTTPPQRITLDLGEKEAEGIYANLALITHSPAEFVLDFARVVPGAAKAKVHARVILTPQAAKGLARLLDSNLERWEKAHGEIKLAGQPGGGHNIGFQAD
ncbi:MAG: DUF3467 domain-containing protein [Candidatus Krumholzibacteriia bacterium]